MVPFRVACLSLLLGGGAALAVDPPIGKLFDLEPTKIVAKQRWNAQGIRLDAVTVGCDSEPLNFHVIAGWSKVYPATEYLNLPVGQNRPKPPKPPELAAVEVCVGDPRDPLKRSTVTINGSKEMDPLLRLFWDPSSVNRNSPYPRMELLSNKPVMVTVKSDEKASKPDKQLVTHEPQDSGYLSHDTNLESRFRPRHTGLNRFLMDHNRFGRTARQTPTDSFTPPALHKLRWLWEPGTDPETILAVWETVIDGVTKYETTSPTLGTATPFIVEPLDSFGGNTTVEQLPKGTVARIQAGQAEGLSLFALGREGFVLANADRSRFVVYLLTGNLKSPANCTYRAGITTTGLIGVLAPEWVERVGLTRTVGTEHAKVLVAWSVCSPAIWNVGKPPLPVDPELWAIPSTTPQQK